MGKKEKPKAKSNNGTTQIGTFKGQPRLGTTMCV
jgi:hypothetical protein